MDEQWKTISTSPESSENSNEREKKTKQFEFVDYLAFSEFSSHDSVTTAGSAPTASSATSVFLPLRTSTTMGNMTDIANTSEFQGFLDDFNCQQSSNMSRW